MEAAGEESRRREQDRGDLTRTRSDQKLPVARQDSGRERQVQRDEQARDAARLRPSFRYRASCRLYRVRLLTDWAPRGEG